ncbi:MAG: hypothetical protein EPN85_11590, partial [Bacteroidetes bacterium]
GANAMVSASNSLILGSNANIGIGTSSPTQKLEVSGAIYSSAGGFKFPDGSVQTSAFSANSINALAWQINGNSGTTPGTDFIGTTDVQDLVFKTNSVEHIRITSTGDHPGNVGIGTDNPQKKLHVVTTHTICSTCIPASHEGIRLEEQTTFSDIPSSSPPPSVWDLLPVGSGFGIKTPSGIPKFMISGAGNVGIGTTNPLAKLEIKGSGTLNTTTALNVTNSNGVSALIVKGDNNVGIGTANPQAKLDVQTNGALNEISTNFSETSSRKIFVVPHLSAGAYNGLSKQDDMGIFWTDGLDNVLGGRNLNAGLVLGPWDHGTTVGLRITHDGKVGIGTANPQEKLEVMGNVVINSGDVEINSSDNTAATSALSVSDNAGVSLMKVKADGKVSIGVEDSKLTNANPGAQYKLYVAGGIITESFRVALRTNAIWGDWVFDENYKNKRMTFEEQSKYYAKNKHLPGIPSASEIKNAGMDVSDMFTAVVINLEEARLDALLLNKENQDQKEEIDALKKQLEQQQLEIEKIMREMKNLKGKSKGQ